MNNTNSNSTKLRSQLVCVGHMTDGCALASLQNRSVRCADEWTKEICLSTQYSCCPLSIRAAHRLPSTHAIRTAVCRSGLDLLRRFSLKSVVTDWSHACRMHWDARVSGVPWSRSEERYHFEALDVLKCESRFSND